VVVTAILLMVAAVGIPSLAGLLDLQQRAAAKELAQTYTWLLDEAALRNACFRVAINLDRGRWQVEVGDPDTLVFSNPEARQEYEEELADKMSRFTERELEENRAQLDDEEEDGTPRPESFTGLVDPAFTTGMALPSGTRFAWVYTPQYGEDGIEPQDEVPEDEEDDRIAYTYIFPDGTAEHTVIRVVGDDDPEDGYTIEVEPLTGRVSLSVDIVSPEQSMEWLPDEGPQL